MAISCAECGWELRAEAEFCLRCGREAPEDGTGPPSRAAGEGKHNGFRSRTLVVGGVMLVLLAAVIGATLIGTAPSPKRSRANSLVVVHPTTTTPVTIDLAPSGATTPQTTEVATSTSTTPQEPPTTPVTASTTVPTTSPSSATLYAITQDVVLRDGPSTVANQMGLIPSGTMIGVGCKASGEVVNGSWGPDQWWDFVTFNGIRGYVTDEWVARRADEPDSTKVPVCSG